MSAERVGILGGGTIACGLALVVGQHDDVVLVTRSEESARRAHARIERLCERMECPAVLRRVVITSDIERLSDRTFVVEAVAEDLSAKVAVLAIADRQLASRAILATTTSSLPVSVLAAASQRPHVFVGFHVFNPVPRMKLIELVFPPGATETTRARAREVCGHLGKLCVEAPDTAGFVVNRLLFPYLFSALRFAEETGMEAEAIDTCMVHGAGHPMGPLALLDYVGLDVAVAIGESLGEAVPATLRTLVSEGALGRKAGRGLYVYDG